MNDYVKTFKLHSKKEVNAFIYDFLNFTKINKIFKNQIPPRPIDYIETFKLENKALINKFIDDFCIKEMMDKAVQMAKHLEWEDEVGIGIYRQEDAYWRAKFEKERLERQFDKKYGLNSKKRLN